MLYRTVAESWLHLKSLGPIDRKFHGHGENDAIVFYEYIIEKFSSFCKYTNIRVLKKKMQIKQHVNSKQEVRLVYG